MGIFFIFMRDKLYIFLLLIFSVKVCGQDKPALERDALIAYTFFVNAEYDSLAKYIHPGNFISASRESFIAGLAQMNSSDDIIALSTVNIPPKFKFGDIRNIKGNYYCIFYYDLAIKIKIAMEVPQMAEKALVDVYKEHYNTDKVRFDSRTNTLFMQRRIKDVAVAEKGTGYQWTFFGRITDKNIREELGL